LCAGCGLSPAATIELSHQRTVKEMALLSISRPIRSRPSGAIRDTFFGTANECHLPVAWGARDEIGQIWAGFAPSTEGFLALRTDGRH
jgi:hypothetical protein